MSDTTNNVSYRNFKVFDQIAPYMKDILSSEELNETERTPNTVDIYDSNGQRVATNVPYDDYQALTTDLVRQREETNMKRMRWNRSVNLGEINGVTSEPLPEFRFSIVPSFMDVSEIATPDQQLDAWNRYYFRNAAIKAAKKGYLRDRIEQLIQDNEQELKQLLQERDAKRNGGDKWYSGFGNIKGGTAETVHPTPYQMGTPTTKQDDRIAALQHQIIGLTNAVRSIDLGNDPTLWNSLAHTLSNIDTWVPGITTPSSRVISEMDKEALSDIVTSNQYMKNNSNLGTTVGKIIGEITPAAITLGASSGARAIAGTAAKGLGAALTPSTYTNLISRTVGLGPKLTRTIGLTADAAAGGYLGYEGAKNIYQGIQNNDYMQILQGAGELAGGGLYAGPGMRTLGITLKNIPNAASGFMKATAPVMKATGNTLLGLTSKYPRATAAGTTLGIPIAALAGEGDGVSGGVNLWPFVIGGTAIGGLYKLGRGRFMREKPIQETLEVPEEISIASPSLNEVMARPSFKMDIGAEYRKLLEPKIGKAPTRPNYEQVPGPYQRKSFVAPEPVTYSLSTTPKGKTKITFSEGNPAYVPSSGVSDQNAYAQNIANKRTAAKTKKAQADFDRAEAVAETAHNKKIQEILDRNTKTKEEFQKAIEPYVNRIKRVRQDYPTLLTEARGIVSKKAKDRALKEWELNPEYKQKHAEFEAHVKEINKQNETIAKSNEAAQKYNAKIPEIKGKLNKWLDRIITLGVFGAGGTGVGLAWNALFGSSRTPTGANNDNEVGLTFNNNPADTNITSKLTNNVEDLFQQRSDEINKRRPDSLKHSDDD